MTRGLLVAAAALTVVTACASPGAQTPHPDGATAGGSPPASPAPPSNPDGNPAGITSEEAARIAPLAPPRLTAVTDAGGVRLTWPATGEDVAFYQCLRRNTPVGEWQPAGRTPPDQHTFLDRNPVKGTYLYGVQAVNAAGLSSPIAESQPVTIA